ncbi:hypothetical protein Tco_0599288 [Tanacetum coccineum]
MRDNTFSGSNNEDAKEHIKKVLEIVDLLHIPNITQDQVMLRAFLMSLTGAASRWLRNEPSGSIITLETLKDKFLSKYCPPAQTAKKMEEINNFQQDPDETLYKAWKRYKELLLRLIMESLVKKKQKGAILKLKRRHLKKVTFYTYTLYPRKKIRRINANSAQETRIDQFPIWRIHYSIRPDSREINPIRRIHLLGYGVSRAFSDTINTRLKNEF